MRILLLLSFLLLPTFLSAAVFAAEVKVAEGVITTQIVERAPIDAVQTYPGSVEKLYCFTRLVGATEDTAVTHVWYYSDREMSRVSLPVRSSDWRTWSSKKILPGWTGDWRVEVLGPDGEVLMILPFTLTGN